MAENTLVRHDKLACAQNSSAELESSVKGPHVTQESEYIQKGDKESMAPNRSFLWGTSVPGTNQFASVPGTNQSASVPGTNQFTSVPGTNQSTSIESSNQTASVPAVVTKHYESAKADNFANVTIYSTDDLYDDVFPQSAVCSSGTSSNHPYSVVQPEDDDVYDDVGPPINEEKQCAGSAAFLAAVR
jgi:CCR4-NOT transcriptional regulation complex NOT5 subunit